MLSHKTFTPLKMCYVLFKIEQFTFGDILIQN
jgi:hypothetical protein